MRVVVPSEVVILNDYASATGGSTAVALASAVELARRGVGVTLFTCVGPVAPHLREVRNLEVICLEQDEIAKNPNRLQAFTSGIRNGRAVRALQRLLATKDRERTIVHAHTWTKALSPFVLEVAARMGFRVVVTLHDFFLACPNGGFFVYPTGALCARRPLSLSCWGCNCDRHNFAHKLWRNARTVVQNKFLRVPGKMAAFVAVSDFSATVMRPYLPARVPLRVVRNPVDCVPAKPADIAGNDRFVFIGRFEVEKGVLLFADAVRATGVPATFIGDGALLPQVRARCPDARYTGWIDQEEIRRQLRTARALVFPSLWYETLGLVVIEAAAAGVPAIVSDRCAVTDYIRDGVNGTHFAHGSVESLAEKMLALSRDGRRAVELGAAAHGWYWRDPWTASRHVSELLEVYRGLVRPAGDPIAEEFTYESAGGIRAGS